MLPTLTLEWLAWSKGLMTSAGLIMAIGAQNAFLLTQSLRRQFHWPIALLCILFDGLLITAGVAGLGVLISQSELLSEIARWGGALFLLWFGYGAARRVFRNEVMQTGGREISSLRGALLMTAAVTLLNPHAWIDTVVLIGSIGGQYDADLKIWFGVGAVCFSAIWFISLCVGARWMAPMFSKPTAWKVLDTGIWFMTWGIAAGLLIGF
ncbi:LysE/ArgO family amino acid transporter [Marinobacterium lutimaris]|uniref:L-lysine exporter family protein LysE/ArgO n=1 Tax=Marinobacterium lutimaris TaxID=568106 RepID=A0A1H6CGI6_9GAMM|nr:LysE/ArgO family amino acid transporter [Marinobacterium lutimaris]SEG72129.1 L-lysine exporter family protein LysE/ArgO [Marinobacterium lutimaris]